MKTVRIGGASSYYSDSTTAVSQLLAAQPPPDYLIFDFMAEGTIARTARERARNPEAGYEADFITIHLARNLTRIAALGVKLIANAGALNPGACARAAQKLISERGLSLKVGYVEGDDLRRQETALRDAGTTEMFSGAAFPASADSINAYLGAFPIAHALEVGADIVITGRCADSALALGALIHEFKWGMEDWDLLAAGTLVGHLLECGCQVTGGTFTDWEEVPGWEDMGFPIADVSADGACVISKPPDTGGLVSFATVAEQLLYEVDDPRAYIVPDVVCDFSHVVIQEVGVNRVAVSNARGRPATDTHKVVASYGIGWRGTSSQVIIGIDAVRKGERQGAALIERGRRLLRERNLGPFTRTHVDCIGGEAAYGPHSRARDVREVFVRAAVDHTAREAVELFLREALASTSGMAPGSTATYSISVTAISKLFMCLVPKQDVPVTLTVEGSLFDVPTHVGRAFNPATLPVPPPPATPRTSPDMTEVLLIRLAWARSGEKGNLFNIAVIARDPEYLPFIRAALTVERVGARFAFLYPAQVQPHISVFDVPGCSAINFVLHDSMDGGLLVSPRVDNAAKGMAQQLLELPVAVPASMLKPGR
jgi:hypothetical protein